MMRVNSLAGTLRLRPLNVTTRNLWSETIWRAVEYEIDARSQNSRSRRYCGGGAGTVDPRPRHATTSDPMSMWSADALAEFFTVVGTGGALDEPMIGSGTTGYARRIGGHSAGAGEFGVGAVAQSKARRASSGDHG
jgi:hypothetical protein